MATYTPPEGDAVNFSFEGGYSAPDGDSVHFLFGAVAVITINSTTRSTVSDDEGFRVCAVNWQSDTAGPYSVELGGSGRGTGGSIENGTIGAGSAIDTNVVYTDITTWSGYSSPGAYQVNIYVKSEDDIWTPYQYSG